MFRIRILAVTVLAALVVAVVGVVGSQAAPQALKGTLAGNVGPGFTITLTKKGTPVTKLKLKAGTYKIVVNDRSSMHNFHLFGPGVKKTTGVSFVGKTVWKVKLVKGKYTYRCDVHFLSGMIGHFKVT